MSRHGFWIAVGIATGAHLVAGSLYLPEALASRKAPEVAISITDGTAYAQMVEKWNQTPEVTGDAAALSSPQDFTMDLPELTAADATDVERMAQEAIEQEDRRKTFVPPEIIFNRVSVEPQVVEMASFSADFGSSPGLSSPSLGTPRTARPALGRPGGGAGLTRSPMAAPSAPRASAAHIRKDKPKDAEAEVAEETSKGVTPDADAVVEKEIVVAIATEVTEEAAPETDALPRPKPRPEWDVEILLTRAEAPLEPVEVVANERDVSEAYLEELAELIREHKIYPDESRARGEQGEVTIEIVLGPDGSLIERFVARSSGFDALDAASLAAVAAAEPFPPLPEEVAQETVTYSVPLNYFLN
ncbi:MAG: TonB family protein [Pseudomonadota bacterium]